MLRCRLKPNGYHSWLSWSHGTASGTAGRILGSQIPPSINCTLDTAIPSQLSYTASLVSPVAISTFTVKWTRQVEFHLAGGLPGVLKQLHQLLDLSAITYTGEKLGNLIDKNLSVDETVIRPLADGITAPPTIAVLKGNLAPRGAILKVSAADPKLLLHTGKALVFEDYQEMLRKIDDDSLPVDRSTVLVLKNAGARGVPGMPEWGMIPIPKKLKAEGVHDMVRISDSRMSGTSFGTVVLHVTPEAATGGVLAIVETGDVIRLDVANGSIELLVDDQIIKERMDRWRPRESKYSRGYPLLYERSILQADEGCDFDFLKPAKGERIGLVEPMVGRS